MRLLDLFCGGGGAAVGYHRAGFEVVGVDHLPQPHFPFEFHEADALEFLAEHGHEFDVIHASPPCQRYTCETPTRYKAGHSDLLLVVADLLRAQVQPYVIENVPGARHLLRNPIMLCGTMFGLRVWRHRWFETNVIHSYLLSPCCHNGRAVLVTGSHRRADGVWGDDGTSECRAAMGIDWMTRTELDQAIPPAYTEWIGRQLLEYLR